MVLIPASLRAFLQQVIVRSIKGIILCSKFSLVISRGVVPRVGSESKLKAAWSLLLRFRFVFSASNLSAAMARASSFVLMLSLSSKTCRMIA